VAPHHWDVDRVRCSDLLHASDDDRASAAMFYYGYLAAKAGIHVIDVSRITDNIAKVMRQCEATPSLTVPQAFREALRPRRTADSAPVRTRASPAFAASPTPRSLPRRAPCIGCTPLRRPEDPRCARIFPRPRP
jgi:hypothetical protein